MTRVSGARLGVDIGGTFTDAVSLDPGGALRVAKMQSTPADLTRGFVDALEALGVAPPEIRRLVHGSTVAANAIVQGRTARVGLLTTAGFRDVLEIGTQQRPSLYDLRAERPAPLVPRELRLEARERVGASGEVLEPLEVADVERAARAFADAGVEAVAVCFLFSFANPAHERRAGHVLRSLLGDIPVSLSSDVAAERREYPRASTTVLNASLLPVAGRYVTGLHARLRSLDVAAPLELMRSNGGVATAAQAARLPVALVASGPAAGVIGAARLGAQAGLDDLLTFDMGGTTADVCLVRDGLPERRFHGEVGGHPVTLPQLDVLSVGAGGGSIARVDRFGSLSVGPESAGAQPGPAGYGLGGEEATVSDAHLVLGTLDPDRFLGGRVRLDAKAAREAVLRRVARPLGVSAEEAAAAVIRIADATMARALRVISIGRGHDPRGGALVAFGGAGPMHACALAAELGMTRVVVPANPGVASALGLLLADHVHDLSRTWSRPLARVRPRELRPRLAALEREARGLLAAAGSGDAGRVELAADLRYRGQAYELTVPLRGPEHDDVAAAERAFHVAHEQAYGHAQPVEETEIVTLRARAVLPEPQPEWEGWSGRGRPRPTAERLVRTGPSGTDRYAVYERSGLGPRSTVTGPAIVEQDDSTTVVAPGWRLAPGPAGLALLERRRR